VAEGVRKHVRTSIPDRFRRPHRIRLCKHCDGWKVIGAFSLYRTQAGNWRRRHICKECRNVDASTYNFRLRERRKEAV
jgi:RNase P subunit RPR2